MEQFSRPAEHNYFNLARLGKNEWWRYLLSFCLIIICWLGFSVFLFVFYYVFSLLGNNPAAGLDTNSTLNIGSNPLVDLTLGLLSFIPLLLSLLAAVKFIHRRPVISLITPLMRIDWKRISLGILVIWLLVLASCIVESVLFPGRYQFTFDAGEYIKFAPLIILFVPIQAATEELLFRGYLTQSLTLLFKRPWIAIVISSALFMSLHFANPEVAVNVVLTLAYYFAVGIFMAMIALKDNRLELALGCHIGINTFVLLANYTDSVLPVPSIFTITTLDPVYNLASFIVMAVIFFLYLRFSKKQSSEIVA